MTADVLQVAPRSALIERRCSKHKTLLEIHTPAERELPASGRRCDSAEAGRIDIGESVDISKIRIGATDTAAGCRSAEVRVVEHVDRVYTKLEFFSLRNLDALDEIDIESDVSGPFNPSLA